MRFTPLLSSPRSLTPAAGHVRFTLCLLAALALLTAFLLAVHG